MPTNLLRATVIFALALTACQRAMVPPPAAATTPSTGATASLPLTGAGGTSSLVSPPAAPESDVAVPIEDDDAVWGARSAPATVVIFSDFQCPFCSRAAATVTQLKTNYGPAKLRLVFKHLPLGFHPNARPAARAAAVVRGIAGNEAFWRFHDLAFANQSDLKPANYELWAERAGANPVTFRAEIDAPRYEGVVARDEQLAQRIGASGTPAFYINGRALSGAQPIEKFSALIDSELSAAAEAAASGTPSDAIYRARTTANYKAPAPDDDTDATPPDVAVWNVPVGNSPVRGPASAPVTIVMFSDFQCPFCVRAEATLDEVRRHYGAKVRLVWKNEPLPFHARALPAAMWALEANAQKGNAGFWLAHDALYKAAPALEDLQLEAIGTNLGLDLGRARAAIASRKHMAAIDADADLAEDFEANGTPHFFINGRRLVGAQPFEKFKALIDEVLPIAEALIAAGTPPERVYDALVKGGKSPTTPTKVALALATGGPVKGASAGTITIAEYADFQCPFCARANTVIAEILKAYPKQVKIEWHDLPLAFHADAQLAAEAGRAVFKLKGGSAFWKYHDALFALSSGGGSLARPELENQAAKLAVDMPAFKAALDNHTWAADVEADAKIAGVAGIQGTPAFLINGYLLSGAQPFRKFRRLINHALEDARAKRP